MTANEDSKEGENTEIFWDEKAKTQQLKNLIMLS